MNAPLYKRGALEVTIARTFDDLMQVVALRGAVYFEEQRCPYEEEFDGNDLAGATHLIVRVNGEPAATMRIRWFADFAKVERVAVRKMHRGGSAARALIRAATLLSQKKGYRFILGHVEPELLAFWKQFGGVKERRNRPGLRFSDRRYIEVLKRLDPLKDAITLNTDALIVLRPEGAWDEPGVLDASAARMDVVPAPTARLQ